MTEQTIASFWDLAYDNGDHLKHWENPHPPLELAAIVAAGLIPSAAKVLDVGCGAGSEAVFLAQCGYQVTGVDSSTRALDLARERAKGAGVEVVFREGDATKLPLADRSIGFASDRGCFHVIDDDQRLDYARDLSRVLEPGASFLLRGARADCDEEGVFAVDAVAIDRYFSSQGFTRGPVVAIDLVAASGSLPSNLVLLQRDRC